MSAAVRQPASVTPPTILVVDDVPMFREMERLFLSRLGQVRTASTIEQALREARVHSPEVILLDLHLPDCEGDEAIPALLAASGPNAAIVMVTAGARHEHARSIRAGAADVLSKPLSRDALIQSVSRFIGRPKRPAGLPRVPHEAPVEVKLKAATYQGTIRNLSRGGLFIESECDTSEGAEVWLTFDLPGSPHRVESSAQVMWRRALPNGGPAGLGVRFVELDGPTSRDIDAFVHERSEDPMPWLAASRT